MGGLKTATFKYGSKCFIYSATVLAISLGITSYDMHDFLPTLVCFDSCSWINIKQKLIRPWRKPALLVLGKMFLLFVQGPNIMHVMDCQAYNGGRRHGNIWEMCEVPQALGGLTT